jgi:hypothetical protein
MRSVPEHVTRPANKFGGSDLYGNAQQVRLPAEYDGQAAFTFADLERMKLGKRSYRYEEIRRGHLVGTKRGRFTIFLRPHVEAWLAAMPTNSTATQRSHRKAQGKAKTARAARHECRDACKDGLCEIGCGVPLNSAAPCGKGTGQ